MYTVSFKFAILPGVTLDLRNKYIYCLQRVCEGLKKNYDGRRDMSQVEGDVSQYVHNYFLIVPDDSGWNRCIMDNMTPDKFNNLALVVLANLNIASVGDFVYERQTRQVYDRLTGYYREEYFGVEPKPFHDERMSKILERIQNTLFARYRPRVVNPESTASRARYYPFQGHFVP